MGIGNIALLSAAAAISKQPRWTFSIIDAVFFALVFTLIGVRYLDIARFQGATAKNEPATRAHWVRYSVGLLLIAVVVWVAVQSV
jgi:hypothetical protein